MRKLIGSLLASLTLAVTSFAGNFYGPNGQYLGQFQPNGNGGGYFYGANGQYQGQFQGNGWGGGYFYGANGQYLGQWQPR